jgi:hypothetical protein
MLRETRFGRLDIYTIAANWCRPQRTNRLKLRTLRHKLRMYVSKTFTVQQHNSILQAFTYLGWGRPFHCTHHSCSFLTTSEPLWFAGFNKWNRKKQNWNFVYISIPHVLICTKIWLFHKIKILLLGYFDWTLRASLILGILEKQE